LSKLVRTPSACPRLYQRYAQQNEKSARSARRHKARGVSPGIKCQKDFSPRSGRQISGLAVFARRVGFHISKMNAPVLRSKAVARCAGWKHFATSSLGLTPQALCCRPLRGLVSQISYYRLIAVLYLTLIAVCFSISAQSQTSPPQSDDVLRISTELVQTDVMVFDRRGLFVDGLKPEQFVLTLNGDAKKISMFERIASGSSAEANQVNATRSVAALPNPAAAIRPGRRPRPATGRRCGPG